MVIEDSPPGSAQLSLFVSGLLVVASGRLTLSPNSLFLLIHLLSVSLGPLRVLLGEGLVFGRLPAVRINRSPELLSLRCVSVRLLAVTLCLGSKPLSQNPLSLRPAAEVGDAHDQCGDYGYDYGDNKNR
jgi:hypothetical protein